MIHGGLLNVTPSIHYTRTRVSVYHCIAPIYFHFSVFFGSRFLSHIPDFLLFAFVTLFLWHITLYLSMKKRKKKSTKNKNTRKCTYIIFNTYYILFYNTVHITTGNVRSAHSCGGGGKGRNHILTHISMTKKIHI